MKFPDFCIIVNIFQIFMHIGNNFVKSFIVFNIRQHGREEFSKNCLNDILKTSTFVIAARILILSLNTQVLQTM